MRPHSERDRILGGLVEDRRAGQSERGVRPLIGGNIRVDAAIPTASLRRARSANAFCRRIGKTTRLYASVDQAVLGPLGLRANIYEFDALCRSRTAHNGGLLLTLHP